MTSKLLSWSAEFGLYGTEDDSDSLSSSSSSSSHQPRVSGFSATAPVLSVSAASHTTTADSSLSSSAHSAHQALAKSPRLLGKMPSTVAAELEHVRVAAHSLSSMRSSSASNVSAPLASMRSSSASVPHLSTASFGVLDGDVPYRAYEPEREPEPSRADDCAAAIDEVVDAECLRLYSSSSTSSSYRDSYDRPVPASEDVKAPPITKSSLASLRSETDRRWTDEWLSALGAPVSERGERMSVLTAEFVRESEALARRIVDERSAPDSERTLRPIAGGICGGAKFYRDGIFCKYAVDNGVFGRDDRKAAKTAGLEKLGLQAFCSISLELDVNVPLMSVVDYAGFRLVTMSAVELSDATLVYGSADGGASVRRREPTASVIDQVCEWLNLAPHDVGGVRLAGPFDLEGHVVHGNGGSLVWAVDFARIFPPEAPLKGAADVGGLFYRQLRPEFCRRWRKPLCADGFTRFSTPAHNTELRAATDFLRGTLVNSLASELLAGATPQKDAASVQQACVALCHDLHFAGVNVRHLGLIAAAVTLQVGAAQMPTLKRTLLLEMIARIVKNRLRALWRELPSLRPGGSWRRQYDYLACVFDARHDDNEFWWRVELKLALTTEFGYALTPAERVESWDVRAVRFDDCPVDFVEAVFSRVSCLAGFSFDAPDFAATLAAIRENRGIRLHVSSKPFSMAPRLEADAMADTARGSLTLNADEREQLYELAFAKYESVLGSQTDDVSTVINYAIALHRSAKLAANRGARDRAERQFVRSQSLLQMALELLGLEKAAVGGQLERRMSSMRSLFDDEGGVSRQADPQVAFRVLLVYANSLLAQAILRSSRAATVPEAAPLPVGQLRRSVALLSLPQAADDNNNSNSPQARSDATADLLQLSLLLYARAANVNAQFAGDSLMLMNWAYAHHLSALQSPSTSAATRHFERARVLYRDACNVVPHSAVPLRRAAIQLLDEAAWHRARSDAASQAPALDEAERLLLRAESDNGFFLACVDAMRGNAQLAKTRLESLTASELAAAPSAADAAQSEWLSSVRREPWFEEWLKRRRQRDE